MTTEELKLKLLKEYNEESLRRHWSESPKMDDKKFKELEHWVYAKIRAGEFIK